MEDPDEKRFRAVLIGLSLYAVMAVICFGPATVQSERAREKHLVECRAEHEGDKERQDRCATYGPRHADGMPKALFWPFWLSYVAASALSGAAED